MPAVTQDRRALLTVRARSERLSAAIHTTDHGQIEIRVSADSAEVCRIGPIGINTDHGPLPSSITALDGPVATTMLDRFSLPTGKARTSSLHASTATVRVAHDDRSTTVLLDVLVADHAVAYRTRLTGGTALLTVTGEPTALMFPGDPLAWLQHHQCLGEFGPAYEGWYVNGASLAQLPSTGFGYTLPALLRVEERWVHLSEAGPYPPCAGSHLEHDAGTTTLRYAFPDHAEGNGHGDPSPVGTAPIEMTWRVLSISADLGDIVTSNVVRHLNPAADQTRDWSWVKPGRVAWSWWSDHDSPTNPATIRRFIDGAAHLVWEYVLVDANWSALPPADIAELAAYAQARGIELMLWYNSGGPNNTVAEQPRDLMTSRPTRRAEMARIAALGVAGIKVDFFHSDKPVTIAQYHDILDDAADHRLMVNFHGCTAPRGWSRRHPHLMTSEAVRGAEWYRLSDDYGPRAPTHNTILPFTRNVVGSMDYTPGVLSDRAIARRTTDTHELALCVLFESSLVHFCDDVDTYLAQPEHVRNYLSNIPTVWDETVLLAGYPGQYSAIARRAGSDWYAAAINGGAGARTLRLDMRRVGLPPDRPVNLITDDPTTGRTAARTSAVGTLAATGLELGPGGGVVVSTS